MTFKMSEQAQTIKIFNLRSDTNEFIGAGDAYIPPHTGLVVIVDADGNAETTVKNIAFNYIVRLA
ncbi:Gifsy-2 prophage tail fiber assembly like-protein [Salmonella enterica subsp. enterica serovar Typhimurium str. DT104]|nr:Gifsy-2 prophage tail fiber assembly like-protein [Salmonella enterica subsp. enterica serovar Typhimurium str. DT104]